jgi:hypothetical protein
MRVVFEHFKIAPQVFHDIELIFELFEVGLMVFLLGILSPLSLGDYIILVVGYEVLVVHDSLLLQPLSLLEILAISLPFLIVNDCLCLHGLLHALLIHLLSLVLLLHECLQLLLILLNILLVLKELRIHMHILLTLMVSQWDWRDIVLDDIIDGFIGEVYLYESLVVFSFSFKKRHLISIIDLIEWIVIFILKDVTVIIVQYEMILIIDGDAPLILNLPLPESRPSDVSR